MSTIYLANGARIIMHLGWKSTTEPSGHVIIRTHNEEYLGCIHLSGVVHLTEICKHTYLPPGVTLDTAFETVEANIKKLGYRKIKQLKETLKDFDARSGNWK